MRRFVSRLFAVISLAVLLVQCLPVPAQAAKGDGVYEITSKSAAFSKDADGLWFPGDSITRVYQVKAAHKKAFSLYFNVDITQDSPLDDVLLMDVKINGKSIYPTPMPISQFQKEHEYVVGASETNTEYAITVSLDTSVTSTYENLELKADFIWKHLEQKDVSVSVQENPKTGDQFPLTVLVVIMVSSLVCLICLFFLWKSREKEDDTCKE